MFQKNHKQIEAKQSWSSKQEISQLKKELEKSYNKMLKEMEEKVSHLRVIVSLVHAM